MNVVQELVTVLRYKVANSEELRTFANAYNNVNTKINDTAASIRRSAQAQTVFNRKQREAVHGADALASAYGRIKAIALGYISLAGIGQFSRLSDEMTKVHSKIRLFAQEGQENNVYRGLFSNAQASGTSIESAADLYATFGATRSQTGLDDRQMVKLTDIIGKAVAVSGGGVTGQRALTQFTQMIAKGRTEYIDVKPLEASSPTFAKLIAEAAGTDIAGLQTRKGGIPIGEILQGFLNQEDKIDKLYEKAGRTFGMGLTRISNKFKDFVGNFNKITHLSQTFYRLSGWIADNLGVIVSLLGYAGAAGAMRWLRASTGAWAGQIRKIGPLLRASLWPLLRMALLFEGLWLLFDDIRVWVHGGKSVIGDIFGAYDPSMLQWLTDSFEWIKNLFGGMQLDGFTGKFIVAASLIMVVVKALKILWKAARGFFLLAKGNPWVLVLTLIVAAALWLAANWDKVCAFLKKAWDGVCNALKAAWDGVCNALKAAWDGVCNALKAAWDGVCNALKAAWDGVCNALKAAWDGVCNALKAAWDGVCNALKAAWDGVCNALKAAWDGVCNALKAAWDGVCNALKAAWDGVCNALKAAWDGVCNALKAAWDGVCNALKAAWDGVCNALKAAWDGVCNALKAAWDGVCNALKAAWDGVCNALKAAWDGVCNALKAAWDGVCSALKAAWDAACNALKGAWNILKKSLTDGWEAIKKTALGVWDAITGKINDAIRAVKKFLGLGDDSEESILSRHEKKHGKPSFAEDQAFLRKRREWAEIANKTDGFKRPIYMGRTPYAPVRNNRNINIHTVVNAANNPRAVADKVNAVVKENTERDSVWEATKKYYGMMPAVEASE